MIMSFQFELHCHTAETSFCASCQGADSVAMLQKAGYDGVAITNHYYPGWFNRLSGSWEEQIGAWLEGYRAAKRAGDELGLSVVLGAELGFASYESNHFLTYGMDEDFFYEYPRLDQMTPAEYFSLAEEKVFYFGQAHPLRGTSCYPEDVAVLHGMELYNSHGERSNQNEKIYEMVRQHGLIGTVGSDFHHPEQMGKTAVLFPTLPKTSAELAELLLQNRIDGYLLKSDDLENIPDVFRQDPRFRCDIL